MYLFSIDTNINALKKIWTAGRGSAGCGYIVGGLYMPLWGAQWLSKRFFCLPYDFTFWFFIRLFNDYTKTLKSYENVWVCGWNGNFLEWVYNLLIVYSYILILKSWDFTVFWMLKGSVFFSGGRFWGGVLYSVNEYTRYWKGCGMVRLYDYV